MTLAEALLYQQELDAAQRPAYGNPNLAAQGRNANIAERSRAFPFMQAADAQFAKEKSSLSDPRAATDLINKGFIAGLGGAPVDLINMGLTPLGMGSAFPFGGSEHIKRAMEDYGVATPTERPIMEGIASLTPPRAVMGAARVAGQGAEAVGRAAAPVAGQALENYMVRTGGILPMDTWHGTPHRFPPTANNPLGEFDPMKIGTGEGAQAYGAGAGYLAEAKGVAANYRNVLSDTLEVKGQAQPLEKRAAQMALTFGDNTTEGALKWLSKFDGKSANHTSPPITPELVQQVKQKFSDGTFSHGGSLYKVDLPDEHIAKMLDWDKPLSQQSDAVQKAIQNIAPDMWEFKNSITGKELYSKLTNSQGWSAADPSSVGSAMAPVSAALRQAGIPGIRYLDQGSRAGGAGTSNFVVFDPAHMNIIGRE